MQEKTFKQDVDRLIEAFLALDNKKECAKFFDDIFTIQELHAVSQRLKVAKMLKDGMTCHAIADETGASTATISRVNKCVHYGKDGYNIVLDKIDKGETDESKAK
jgi:TrpR-related protein YerC/YecD